MASVTATLQQRPADLPRTVSILGATGSVGRNTLDLIARNPGQYKVVALTANSDAEGLAELALRHQAELAVVADPAAYDSLKQALSGSGTRAAAGPEALVEAAGQPADWIMAAIMGAAGLRPTLRAVEQGTHVA
ncbi:MAG: 1-deoxy-D-xylulose-5-phosphate reductoisomerase, partial [Alphaproteobacteria bacterium]